MHIEGKCKNCGAVIRTEMVMPVWAISPFNSDDVPPAIGLNSEPVDTRVECPGCRYISEWMALMTATGTKYHLALISEPEVGMQGDGREFPIDAERR